MHGLHDPYKVDVGCDHMAQAGMTACSATREFIAPRIYVYNEAGTIWIKPQAHAVAYHDRAGSFVVCESELAAEAGGNDPAVSLHIEPASGCSDDYAFKLLHHIFS